MSVQNGDVVILQIGGVQVGALVSNSQNMTADMLDKTNKDTPGIKQYDAGEDGWTLSVEALWDPAATEGFSEALGYLKAGTQVTILHGVVSGESWQGFALIASVDVSGPKNEIASYSLELQGTSTFGTFSAEYQAVYNSFTTKPSAAVAGYQNTMVQALVDAGIWTKLDVFYVYAAHTNGASEALINWADPGTNDSTLVNAPSFVALEGFTGNGTTSYINTHFSPANDGVNYVQDSASFGVYIRTNVAESDYDMGAATPTQAYLATRTSGDAYIGRVNDVSSFSTANTDSRGMHILSRTASNARVLYRNSSNIDSDAAASGAPPTYDMYVCTHNSSGSPSTYSTKQISLAFAGAGLNQTEVTAFTNIVEVYMDSNGKGVIT